ncbi:PKD domain-containing protein [Yeosuana marina]|uniref:PKD domain-containing protein n=1 Tax=Yeosuana marina TaxID=1565536 RepID=UPI001F0D9565|nr:PKD domain-containing protein [Yeosuana marina]
MKKINRLQKRLVLPMLTIMGLLAVSLSSCDPSIESLAYDLPDANSKADLTPPAASFSAAVTSDYLTYTFGNSSTSATDYVWDYGDGNSSTGVDGENTYPGEGTYTVTLTASDKLGVTSTFSLDIEVVEPPTPAAITPEILHGDFDTSTNGSTWDDWKFASFSDGTTTNPYNASSDGSPLNYDGSDSGSSKTPGAKWTGSTSAGPSLSTSTRYAYQAITVTPNTEYFIEYEYAIKTDVADIDGGDRVIVEILDGWFDDGVDAVASSNAGPLVQAVGATANGKGNFEKLTTTFTSNATGQVSILIYAITNDELYVDNVKVYPVE